MPEMRSSPASSASASVARHAAGIPPPGAATPISNFVDRHPTVKMLALSFLVLIGTNLVAEGIGQHIPKGYTYFAMAFSVLVEMLNIRVRAASKKGPVKLRDVPHESSQPQ